MQTWTIGQVAREAGVGVETIRFYERQKLLKQPSRRSSGYRQFDVEAVTRLRFIKQSQRLGFTLREIRELLSLRLDPDCTRGKIKARAEAKIVDIDSRIQELRKMRKALVPLIEACDGAGDIAGCPILAAMDSVALSPSQQGRKSKGASNGPTSR